jgi:hypothetical protein
MTPKTIFVILLAAILLTSLAAAQRISPLTYDDPEFEWLDNRDPDSPRPSPNAFTGLQVGSTRVMVAYGSPAAKGRKVFGGLVPYGRLWRTGANEATTLTTNGETLIGGHELEAGTYTLFTIPRESEWTIVLNSDNNQWGAYERDPELDVLEIKIPSEQAEFRENLTFGFEGIDPDGSAGELVIAWETTAVRVPIAEAD